MEIVGTGFGRTGTLSTQKALELLGFGPCHHMFEAFKHPSHFRVLERHLMGEAVDWSEMFSDYRSQVDFPGAVIWRELLAAYPEARVLHTVRDPDRWYDSTSSTIYRARSALAPWARRWLPVARRAFAVNDALIWDGLFAGRFEDRAHAIQTFERRTAEVIAEVPAERLLIFNVADGWEPLCEFLGVPVPDEPFPHLNDSVQFKRRIWLSWWGTRALPWVFPVLGLAGVIAAFIRRRSHAAESLTKSIVGGPL